MSSKQQKRKGPEEEEGPPTPPKTVDDEEITVVKVSKDDPKTLEIVQTAKRPRTRTPILMTVEDEEEDEEFIPEEVFKQYEEFRQDGSENALMFFVRNPQYEKWGQWIMENYKKAKEKYMKDDTPLVAAAAAASAPDERK